MDSKEQGGVLGGSDREVTRWVLLNRTLAEGRRGSSAASGGEGGGTHHVWG